MTPERFAQIEEVFCRAAELAPVERTEFLDKACASDTDLRREVESLLAEQADTKTPLRLLSWERQTCSPTVRKIL
jgi:hypothetical protein